METTAFEFDSLSDLPPLPQEYKPMEYYRNSFISPPPPLESLAPFPPSDFTFSDLLQQQQLNADYFFPESNLSVADSFLLDSPLSLLNRHHLTESAQFQQLFHENNAETKTQFLHLPDLKSIEQTTTTTAVEDTTKTKTKPFLSLSPPVNVKRRKILRSSSSSTSGSTLENIVNRRKKISDKIRSLEKLMPWESKMSLAMVLEESYKYIKFLQSQINVLRWMPLESVYNTTGEVIGDSDLLKSLTRQQILQVLANSPGSRNVLATRGVCVFSYEQLLSLKSMSRNL